MLRIFPLFFKVLASVSSTRYIAANEYRVRPQLLALLLVLPREGVEVVVHQKRRLIHPSRTEGIFLFFFTQSSMSPIEQFPNPITREKGGWADTFALKDGKYIFLNGERTRDATPEEMGKWAETHRANIEDLASKLTERAAALLKDGGEHHVLMTMERHDARTPVTTDDEAEPALHELVGATY